MQIGVQRGNDRRRRQHGNPQTCAGQPEQEEGDQARVDDGSLVSWRFGPELAGRGGGASLHERRAGKNHARHSGTRAKPAGPESITTDSEVLDAIRDYLHVRDYGFRAPRFARPWNDEGFGERVMAFGYRYKLERQRNG
jgi:hypothetical protein